MYVLNLLTVSGDPLTAEPFPLISGRALFKKGGRYDKKGDCGRTYLS